MQLWFVVFLSLTMSAAAFAAERTATFAVSNMTCATCALTIEVAVKKIRGVKDVRVNYDRKTATVVYDDARTTSDAIAAVMNDAGFPAARGSGAVFR
jgi:periplasmic mercuric ion binding protein